MKIQIIGTGQHSLESAYQPYFLDNKINAEKYEEILKAKLWLLLRDRQHVYEILFPLKEALPHYGFSAQKWLNEHYPYRWIGRRSANSVTTQIIGFKSR